MLRWEEGGEGRGGERGGVLRWEGEGRREGVCVKMGRGRGGEERGGC